MAYDNTNKASLWNAAAFSGKANLGGTDYYADMVPTRAKSDKAPVHTLYLRADRSMLFTPLFTSRGGKSTFTGALSVAGTDYWVNVYENDSDKSNAPKWNIQFREKDAQGVSNGSKVSSQAPEDGEEAPF